MLEIFINLGFTLNEENAQSLDKRTWSEIDCYSQMDIVCKRKILKIVIFIANERREIKKKGTWQKEKLQPYSIN